jgi:hypothetical protein
MTAAETLNAADTLRAARRLIADPERWSQGSLDADGRFCAIGALAQVRSYSTTTARLWLDYAAGQMGKELQDEPLFGPCDPSAAMWINDYVGHAAILECFDRAIRLAERYEPKLGRKDEGRRTMVRTGV